MIILKLNNFYKRFMNKEKENKHLIGILYINVHKLILKKQKKKKKKIIEININKI